MRELCVSSLNIDKETCCGALIYATGFTQCLEHRNDKKWSKTQRDSAIVTAASTFRTLFQVFLILMNYYLNYISELISYYATFNIQMIAVYDWNNILIKL